MLVDLDREEVEAILNATAIGQLSRKHWHKRAEDALAAAEIKLENAFTTSRQLDAE